MINIKKLSLFQKVLLIGLSLRVFFQALAFLAIKFIPFKASFPYWESILADKAPAWLWFWGNFDGVHYLNIVDAGYKYGLTQAFFPLYPIIIKLVNLIISNSLISALIISHISFIGFIYYFIKLGLLDFSKKTIFWASLLLLLFPTSFFFFGVYTESLFLLLVAASFFLMQKKKFFKASVLAGLASATRFVGIFLIPAILWDYYQNQKKLKLTKRSTKCLPIKPAPPVTKIFISSQPVSSRESYKSPR